MKSSIISFSLLATLAIPPEAALAGDMGPVQQAFSWDGFYAGITGGTGKLENKGQYYRNRVLPGTVSVTPNVTNTTIETDISLGIPIGSTTIVNVTPGSTTTIPGVTITDFMDFNPNDESWFLGGEVGYDKQFGSLLAGVIWDVSGANYKTNQFDSARGIGVSADLEWFSTLRFRLGVPINQFLVYGTAGAAMGHFNVTSSDTTGSWSNSYTEPGWAAGAGAAYAVSPNWMVDLSYLYLDFSSRSEMMGPASIKTDLSANVVKLGINYRF